AVSAAGAAHRGDSSGDGGRLALAHLPQRGPHSLLGQTGLPFTLSLLPLEPLQRRQKPWRLWLAEYHVARSFLRARRVTPGGLSVVVCLYDMLSVARDQLSTFYSRFVASPRSPGARG